MKKIISCLFAVILCIGCFASTVAFADEVRQSPSDFAKDFVSDYIEYTYLGISRDIGKRFSDMMSGADFERMVAAAKKDGEILVKHQSEFEYNHKDTNYENRTAEEIVTTFPTFIREWMTVVRQSEFARHEKLSFELEADNETNGTDGLVYVSLRGGIGWNYIGDGTDSASEVWYYLTLFDNGSDYYVCDFNDMHLGVIEERFESFNAIKLIRKSERMALYPYTDKSWPELDFEKVSETGNTKEPVESEPTDSGATEPVQEKGTGEDALLPTAALVTIIGTAVIICLIIALCVILRRQRQGKRQGEIKKK